MRSLLLVSLVFTLNSVSSADEGWVSYEMTDGSASLKFPAKPEAEVREKLASGETISRVAYYDGTYEIGLGSNAVLPCDKRTIEDRLQHAAAGYIQGCGPTAKVIYNRASTYQGHQARDVGVAYSDRGFPLYGRCRLIATETHLLHVGLFRSDRVAMDVKFADMFFESLTVHPRK